ncbi:sensor histidine kinase [Streptomyces sp. 8N616]|uniref:sensor histidine kinase n=1 Tax=Streptomyces sp. 8N616 TaxID=3457414 RepID=UPI003FD611BB
MRHREVLADAVLWVALAVPVAFGDSLGRNQPLPWWQTIMGVLLLAVAVALARTRPALALLVVAALGLAATPGLFTVSYGPALSAVAYLLGRRADAARPALSVFAAVGVTATALIVVEAPPDPVVVWLVMVATLLFGAVFPWLAGRYRRQDRALVAAGWSRAEQLEREQEIVADRTRLRERARIAQDMHDSLGHELSLIALRAGALQVAPGLTTEHRAAAGELRAAAADATDRLHEIIGVLREGEGRREAPLVPPAEAVEALVERARDSGLDVRLSVAGEGELTGMGEQAVHRVVQESLTNAAKHAPGASVTVELERSRAGVLLTVRNASADGGSAGGPAPAGTPGSTPGRRGSGDRLARSDSDGVEPGESGPRLPVSARRLAGPASSGTGLAALAERVRLVGGELSAGPYEGGFRLVARVPCTPGTAGTDGKAPASGPAAGPPPGPEPRTTSEPACGTALGPGGGPHPTPAGRARPLSAANPSLSRPGMTAAARQFVLVRRGARRRVLGGFAAAGGAAVVLVGGVFGWYAYVMTHSVLPPAAYDRLAVGDSYADVARLLPDREVTDTPTERAPAPPPGADCHYYRSSDRLFHSVDDYRLCFRDGRLVAKTLVPEPTGEETAR